MENIKFLPFQGFVSWPDSRCRRFSSRMKSTMIPSEKNTLVWGRILSHGHMSDTHQAQYSAAEFIWLTNWVKWVKHASIFLTPSCLIKRRALFQGCLEWLTTNVILSLNLQGREYPTLLYKNEGIGSYYFTKWNNSGWHPPFSLKKRCNWIQN